MTVKTSVKIGDNRYYDQLANFINYCETVKSLELKKEYES